MKPSVLFAMIVVAVSVGPVEAAEPRPMTAEDLWKVKRIGPPSVSPDGQWCVVDVTTWDLEKDDTTARTSTPSCWFLK